LAAFLGDLSRAFAAGVAGSFAPSGEADAFRLLAFCGALDGAVVRLVLVAGDGFLILLGVVSRLCLVGVLSRLFLRALVDIFAGILPFFLLPPVNDGGPLLLGVAFRVLTATCLEDASRVLFGVRSRKRRPEERGFRDSVEGSPFIFRRSIVGLSNEVFFCLPKVMGEKVRASIRVLVRSI